MLYGIFNDMVIKSDIDAIRNYFEDSSNLKGGHADKVVVPEDAEELSSFIQTAAAEGAPVTVSGGGTGTTGSRIPFGGVALSMEKFNDIREVSVDGMSAIAGAGVFVDALKSAAEAMGLFYVSHPTEGSAMIGGTVATNASGARSFRYGPTRKYVKRLKMVMADGEIFEITRGEKFLSKNDSYISFPSGRSVKIPMPSYVMPAVKNSAGYYITDGMDLIDLFIGQEGTLSVITEVEMGLVKKPAAVLSCFVFFKKEEDAWFFSEEIKKRRNMGVMSVEYFDMNAVRMLMAKNSNVPRDSEAAIFFEQDMDELKIESVLSGWEAAISRHSSSLDDTWVAMNEKEAQAFTALRYAIPETINDIIRRSGFKKFSTDIAVPDDNFLKMLKFYRKIFRRERIGHVIFGHIGESHLHVNILPTSPEEVRVAEKLAAEFVKKGVSLGGTISAEHGVGKLKHRYLETMYGRRGVLEMARLKKTLDPKCILGLDNIFDKELLV